MHTVRDQILVKLMEREDFPARTEVASPVARDAGPAQSPPPPVPASSSQTTQAEERIEGGLEPETRLDVAVAGLVFWVVAMWAVCAGKVASAWLRAYFWLTTSVDCALCKRRLRQAWFPRRFELVRGTKVWRVSHTYCPKCFEKAFGGFSHGSASGALHTSGPSAQQTGGVVQLPGRPVGSL